MFAAFGANLDERLETLELSSEARQQLEAEKVKLGAAEAPEGLDPSISTAVERAIDEAFVSGYRAVMLVAVAMALDSAISAAVLIEGKKPKAGTEKASAQEGLAPGFLNA
jgi:ABC-type branched-subunit amino acid transport system ATPase component